MTCPIIPDAIMSTHHHKKSRGRAWMEIRADALRHNLDRVRDTVGPDVSSMNLPLHSRALERPSSCGGMLINSGSSLERPCVCDGWQMRVPFFRPALCYALSC